MLVATANWAIPDGSLAAAPPVSLVGQMVADARRMAWRAGFRADGRYRPIERVVFLLVGDTCDGLLSARWLASARPWERRRGTALRHRDVLHDAWHAARRPLARITRLVRTGIVVPTSDHHGRPVLGAGVRVPVQVVVLLGDRDAASHALGFPADAERRRFDAGASWEGGGVRVMHGDDADPLAMCEGGPSLRESMTVDLLARFGAAIVAQASFAERGRRLMRLLADAPLLDVPQRLRIWLDTMHESGDVSWIAASWRRSVDRWSREARRLGCAAEPGVVDAVGCWMHAGVDGSTPTAAVGRIVGVLHAASLPERAPAELLVVGHPAEVPCTAGDRVVCLGVPGVGSEGCPGRPREAASAVSCLETGFAAAPARLPALAVFEGDEAGRPEPGWRHMREFPSERTPAPAAVPVLDAA